MSSDSLLICQSVSALWSESGEPIRIQGATASARAWTVLQLRKSNPAHCLVICPDDDEAASFAADLESLRLDDSDHSNFPVLLLPTWDQSPYTPIAPSIRTRFNRIAALSKTLNLKNQAPVIVSSIAALSQATCPQALFARFGTALKPGDDLGSRERWVARFVDAGYLNVDPVEDMGTFAVRGDIIDVYPPDADGPIRIEIFGSEIEKIRPFNPETQRGEPSSAALSSVWIPPAREVLINSVTAPMLRERLKARADDLGVPRSIRDPILSQIQDGNYPDHCDAWADFAYSPSACFVDYLPAGFRVFWSDELACLQKWDEWVAENQRLCQPEASPDLILPPPNRVFLWGQGLDLRIRSRSEVIFDQIQLANLESIESPQLPKTPKSDDPKAPPSLSRHHRVFIKENLDLIQDGARSHAKHSLSTLEPKLKLWGKQGFRVVIFSSTESQLERIRFLLGEHGIVCTQEVRASCVSLRIGSISSGFRWPAEGLVVLSESDVLGSQRKRGRESRPSLGASAAKEWSGLRALTDLSPGDPVVHVDHGVGRYQGLARLDFSGAPSDFLVLEYANKDKLYLPVYRLNVIQKYIGGEAAPLDRLGSRHFTKAKEGVKKAVRTLAIDLVKLYAERKIRPGVAFSGRDSFFREFEAKFPFEETPDQLKAVDQCLGDMESGRAMDRLVCGDVGYGKTEVAMRAAFRAVTDGKQVAVLVPTTVLAFQHEQSFRARFKDYPISVDTVSRFKSAKEQKASLAALAAGGTDIIIGTHRLLSKDVQFKDLGLIIVDEEHRFGVEHKERLKTLKTNTHVLTLTATPIPRTLHMALAGLRDISLIHTPPVNRLPIRTYVSKYDNAIIQRAIQVELARGGQVFFLHNRVDTIDKVAAHVRELAPTAVLGVGHGQMAEGELEKTMLDFYQKRTNVLVCTTIIESGLDLPSANTIIINRADALGLAQLYQLRGRVGRGQLRAYAYLLIPAESVITDEAKRRLEVIQRFVELGSGFSIASHDLEIRGGGDLLGPQQSGHIATVGFDLYTELLEEAIHELQHSPERATPVREPEIKVPFAAYLDEDYVPDIHQRLSLYRRFSGAAKDQEIDRLEEELRDRFGQPPPEALNLLWLIRLKLLLMRHSIDSLTAGPERLSLVIGAGSSIDPARAIALVSTEPRRYQLIPDSAGSGGTKLVAHVTFAALRDLCFALENLFDRLRIAA